MIQEILQKRYSLTLFVLLGMGVMFFYFTWYPTKLANLPGGGRMYSGQSCDSWPPPGRCRVVSYFMDFSLPAPLLASTASPRRYDPLSQAERQKILEVLEETVNPPNHRGRQREIRLIERRQEYKGAYREDRKRRRGDFYVYDYDTDTLVYAVVNLKNGRVNVKREMKGIQLPLTEREMRHAIQIAYNDVQLRRIIRRQYEAITGQPLRSANQLNVQAVTFLAKSMPDELNAESQACGEQRCAQLLIFTQENDALEVLPIVNLSSESVAQVLRFGPTMAGVGATQ